jgi:hypothetical protein
MSAKDYKLCVSALSGKVFISKISKRHLNLMTSDRQAVEHNEFIGLLIEWLKIHLGDDQDTLFIEDDGKIIAELHLKTPEFQNPNQLKLFPDENED